MPTSFGVGIVLGPGYAGRAQKFGVTGGALCE